MAEYLVNNKLGRIWNEAVLTLQWYYLHDRHLE